MDFTDVVKQTGGQCKFSPDGTMVATASAHRLSVRATASMEIVALFTCVDAADAIEWSPDSAFVLSAHHTRGVVQVRGVKEVSILV